MKALGILTSGVAHDFNNILAVLLSCLELIKLDLADEQVFNSASKTIERGKMLVTQLLDSSRGINRKIVSNDLDEVLENIQSAYNVNQYVEVDLKIEKHFSGEILAEDGLLEATISNLVFNALQAMDMKGEVRIRTLNATPKHLEQVPDRVHDNYAAIEIIDGGPGIDPKILKHIFEPFFSTKPAQGGTGLGLSMAKGFAQRSNGNIFYRYNKNGGSIFSLILPISTYNKKQHSSQKFLSKVTQKDTNANVLLVDDERTLAISLQNLLRSLKYNVIMAHYFDDAIALLDKSMDFDIVITDMYILSENGLDLLRYAKGKIPDVKGVLISGNFTQEDIRPDDIDLVDKLLSKPFKFDELKAALNEL